MTILRDLQKSALTFRGFSLIEIVVVLGISAFLLTTAVFVMNAPNEEKTLRGEHAKIEDLVRQGRALAVSYQQAFILELSEGVASLRPIAVLENEDQYSYLDVDRAPSSLRPLQEMNWPRIENLNPEYELSVRRWGQVDFNLLDQKRKEIILLEPGGMCEPMSVLLSKDLGDKSLSRIYHPLTGLAEDEALTITADR
ncbi:prepilin-type N-terminal cleavage/methylation domain-containing protein [Akkermansiaceae bacterium]|nr:prepilin-type N-terminal cleavage/methylation domain-containing protein [bacterium]MDB4435917.1 prepilin-type N-terminal cleavage/methylation domain-containing protein [Akkermansiaceae bacterium]